MPSRAVSDQRLQPNVVRTLSALCCYTSANGICYPNQITLGDLIGVSQPLVARNMGILRKYGYVIDLEPLGKKRPLAWQRGNRYFIPVNPNDPIPSKEVMRSDTLAPNRVPPVVIQNGGGMGE